MDYDDLAVLDDTDIVAMTAGDLRRIWRVAQRLYSERRMNGDEMRDSAHALAESVRQSFAIDEEL
jgi:hypothetical protein